MGGGPPKCFESLQSFCTVHQETDSACFQRGLPFLWLVKGSSLVCDCGRCEHTTGPGSLLFVMTVCSRISRGRGDSQYLWNLFYRLLCFMPSLSVDPFHPDAQRSLCALWKYSRKCCWRTFWVLQRWPGIYFSENQILITVQSELQTVIEKVTRQWKCLCKERRVRGTGHNCIKALVVT